jgi:hypothetical protein
VTNNPKRGEQRKMANEIANVRFRYIIDTGTGLRRQ